VTSKIDNVEAWKNLLGFGEQILTQPPRTGKRHNLTATIKKRIINKTDQQAVTHNIPCHKKANPESQLAAAVSAKVEEGNLRAALRILCSEDKPADASDDTFHKLVERHPTPANDRTPFTEPNQSAAIQVTTSEVAHAIRTFPAGSSGGPDGIKPQHIQDLLNCREESNELLHEITLLINLLLEGKGGDNITPILYGGKLIALEKKTGGGSDR